MSSSEIGQVPDMNQTRQTSDKDRSLGGLMVTNKLQIAYQDLAYSVPIKQAKTGLWLTKEILKGVNGVIEPARLTAVMGASGAGKTSFLNVLAGYTGGGKVTVGGSISINGEVVGADRMRQISGFVHQEDCILETMTVREVLYFAAELKLPGDMTVPTKLRRALDVAAELNISKVLDNEVGSVLKKGISGGERRRLSLGMEMITNPSVLFLDEPTSGLDTHTAYKVVSILQSVAHRQSRTIVATIHQPSSDIFRMFDDLIVLADGKVMFHGLTSNMVVYFDRLGYQCPNYTNPADYLFMDVLNRGVLLALTQEAGARAAPPSGDLDKDMSKAASLPLSPSDLPRSATPPPQPEAPKGFLAKVKGLFKRKGADEPDQAAGEAKAVEEQRIRGLLDSWQASPENAAILARLNNSDALLAGGSAGAVHYYAGFWLQFSLLSARAARNMWRNPLILKGKLGTTLILSIVVGLIYKNVGNDLVGVQDREGSIFFLLIQGIFSSVMGVVTCFGGEKAVFKREYGSKLYGMGAYFWSRYLVELPAQIICPILCCLIVYWLIGYQNEADKFLWFMLVLVLINLAGASLGFFIACIFDQLAVAIAFMPAFIMPIVIFSGFFVNATQIPNYFYWIQFLSPMRYAFFAAAKNEFTGLDIQCTPSQNCAAGYDGQDVLNLLGVKKTVAENCLILLAMVVGLLGFAYLALWNTVRKMKQ